MQMLWWCIPNLFYPIIQPSVSCLPLSLQATEQAKEEIKRVLSLMNQHLNTRTFLVGERVSLADISVACSMLWLYKQVRDGVTHSMALTVCG